MYVRTMITISRSNSLHISTYVMINIYYILFSSINKKSIVDSEIFARILFSQRALKDILELWEIHD